MASHYQNPNQPVSSNPQNNPYYNVQNSSQEYYQNRPRNEDWTSYPMGNVNAVDIEANRNPSFNRGVELSPNVKNCLLATAITCFVVFVILWIS